MDDMVENTDKLIEQLNQLMSTLDNVKAYIYIKDINGKYTFANRMVCDLFGLPLSEIVGKGDDCFFDVSKSDNLSKFDSQVLHHGKRIESIETNFIKLTGESRIYSVVKCPLYGSTGKISGMCGISIDITEKHDMEQKLKSVNQMLRTILDNAPSFIYMKDSNCKYSYVNVNFAKYLGLSESDIVGKTDAEIMPLEIAERIAELDQEMFATGNNVSGEEVLIGQDGDPNYFWSVKIPLIANDSIYALVGISYDITDLTLLKIQLESQNEELQNVLAQKNLFMGIVVHDLRNPISAILGISEIIAEQVSDDLKSLPKLISEASASMLELVNSLLDISEIESGKLTLNKSNLDYVQFVDSTVRLNQILASNKNITIQEAFNIKECYVDIDKGKIEQVLNNLLSNAVKYSNPNKTITVKLSVSDGVVLTQVIDQGLGIPHDEIPNVFQYFKKTSVHPTANEKSHGLGLAIAKKIVEGHGGNIYVTSQVGVGSTFEFTLPVLP